MAYRLGKMTLAPELFLSFFRGVHPGYWCTSNPIPEDARVAWCGINSRMQIEIILESASFPETESGCDIPDIPDSVFGTFTTSLDEFYRDHPEYMTDGPPRVETWHDRPSYL